MFLEKYEPKQDDDNYELLTSAGNLAYGGFNRENLIYDYPSKEIEEQIIYDKYCPIVYFAKHYQEVLDLITNFKYEPNTFGSGFIIHETKEKLNVSEKFALNLLNLTVNDLIKENIEYAKG